MSDTCDSSSEFEVSTLCWSRQNSSSSHSRTRQNSASTHSQTRQNFLQEKTDSKYGAVRIVLNHPLNLCSDLDSSSEKEEKAIAAIKKEPIQVDQFLQRLRQKKLDKYLNFEVRVS